MEPEFAKAADLLSNHTPPVVLAKVDASLNRDLAERYDIKGVPTLKWFIKKKPYDYHGGRTASEIVNWVKWKSGPPSITVNDAELEYYKKKEKAIVVFYGDVKSKEFEEFKKVAAEDTKHMYMHNLDKAASLPKGMTRPGVAIYNKLTELPEVFDKEISGDQGFEKSAIDDWVSQTIYPPVCEFNDESAKEIIQNNKPAVILFMDNTNEEHVKIAKNFNKSVKKNPDMVFAHSGIGGDGIQGRLASMVGLTNKNLPKMLVMEINPTGIVKYEYKGDLAQINKENFNKFLTQYDEGTLEKHLKSDEIPEKNDEPVKIVVAKSFNDIVGKDKDVLLDFYAPWCGPCKEMEPKYNELAKDLKNVKNLVIAKCDGTTNEIDGQPISAYPTIKFYAKGSTNGIPYQGHREVNAFKDFLKEYSESYKASIK